MVTTNIVQRTFRIRSTQEGTCFTIDVDNRQYIVTARHLVEKVVDQSSVKIMQEKKWKDLQVKLVGHCKGKVDISVLASDLQISPAFPLSPTMDGMMLGQDVYFLGFPFGLTSDVGPLNRNFPFPLVKKGIVSLVAERGQYILLDGHNNPGFSGGPVVFRPNNHGNDFAVAGIVTGHHYVREPVYQDDKQTSLSYKSNTGIILAYSIKHALDLIAQKPIGVKLETSKVQK